MGRPHKNAMRKALKPGPLCVDSKDGTTKTADSSGGGKPNKQYNFTKVANSGPNYTQQKA